jgi:uncharacterized protein YlaI
VNINNTNSLEPHISKPKSDKMEEIDEISENMSKRLREIYLDLENLKAEKKLLECRLLTEYQKSFPFEKKCFICNSVENLHKHHLLTNKFYKDRDNYLIILCRECHFKVHKNYNRNWNSINVASRWHKYVEEMDYITSTLECLNMVINMKKEKADEHD